MSNFENMSEFPELDQYDRNYNAAIKKLKAANAEKEAAIAEWESDMSPNKPSLEFVVETPPLSQQEMEDRAHEIAKEQIRQNEVMERQGLMEPDRDEEQAIPEETQSRSFAEKQAAKRGEQAIEQAREDARQEQELERDRKQGREF